MGARHYSKDVGERRTLAFDGPLVPVAVATVCALLLEGLYLYSERPAVRVLLMCALGCVLVVGIVVIRALFGKNDDSHLFAHRVYPVLFVVLGLVVLFFSPPRTVPDEDYHYLKSYSYANLLVPGMGTTDMREEDRAFIETPDLYNRSYFNDYWGKVDGWSLFATHDGTVTIQPSEDEATRYGDFQVLDIGMDTPQTKIASGLGIFLGRLLGLSGIAVFYLGRLFNFAFCAALIILAVRLTPIGKSVFIAVSMLPMTLFLLASYSYDAGVIGFSILLISLLLRMMHGTETIAPRLMIASVVVAMLVAPGKLIYTLMALLCLFVPNARFSSRKQAVIWKFCMLCLPIVAVFASRFAKIVSMSGINPSSQTGQTRRGAGYYFTLSDAIADPGGMIQKYLRTIYLRGDFYLTSMLGGMPGWFEAGIEMPWWQVCIWVMVLAVSAMQSTDDGQILRLRYRVGMALVGIGGFALAVLSLLFAWSFVTDKVIEGVQGRYFLPFLPCVLFALRGKTLRFDAQAIPVLLVAICGLSCLNLMQLYYAAIGGVPL